MDCPHCKQELPALPCPACQRSALAGAGYCHHCGHELPGPVAEPPKLIACDSCGRKALPEASYCSDCGEPLAGGEAGVLTPSGFDPGERVACSDGLCIGIIGVDGKCTECGRPHRPSDQ